MKRVKRWHYHQWGLLYRGMVCLGMRCKVCGEPWARLSDKVGV